MSKGFRKVSSGATKRKFTLGCESCNFTQAYVKEDGLKTGSDCPRCDKPTVRLFDSTSEALRNCELLLLLRAGEISNLQYQRKFPLSVINPDGEEVTIGNYVCDFAYFLLDKPEEDGLSLTVEDVKGNVVTDIFELKKKHFEAQYGFKIKLVKR